MELYHGEGWYVVALYDMVWCGMVFWVKSNKFSGFLCHWQTFHLILLEKLVDRYIYHWHHLRGRTTRKISLKFVSLMGSLLHAMLAFHGTPYREYKIYSGRCLTLMWMYHIVCITKWRTPDFLGFVGNLVNITHQVPFEYIYKVTNMFKLAKKFHNSQKYHSGLPKKDFSIMKMLLTKLTTLHPDSLFD